MKKIDDAETYRKMSEPHSSKDALNKDLKSFYEAFRKLREEHNLLNVVCIIESPYLENEIEGNGTAIQVLGDIVQAQSMAAYACGYFRNEWANNLAALMKGSK